MNSNAITQKGVSCNPVVLDATRRCIEKPLEFYFG
jgi:hypothetical protein